MLLDELDTAMERVKEALDMRRDGLVWKHWMTAALLKNAGKVA